MSDSNRYIFVTQNKLEDFARYDIGMSDLAEDGNDDSHAGYMEGISVECENSYPIQVTDLITAVENFRDENITIYDFLYEWWYPVMVYFYRSLCLDSLMPTPEDVGRMEVPPFPITEDDMILTIFNIIGRIANDPRFNKDTGRLLSSALDLDAMIDMMSNFLEDLPLPLDERRYTDPQMTAFINHWNNNMMLEDAPDYVKTFFRKFTDEMSDKGNVDAMKAKAYACYGGNCIYSCDYNEAARLLELLWKDYGFGYAANTLGYIYYYGMTDNYKPDYERAFYYYSVASSFEIIEAKYKIADMFFYGNFVKPNPSLAFNTYTRLYSETRGYFQDGDYSCEFADCALRFAASLSIVPNQLLNRYKILLEARYAVSKRINTMHHGSDSTIADTIENNIAETKEKLLASPDYSFGTATRPAAGYDTMKALDDFVNAFPNQNYSASCRRTGKNRLRLTIRRLPDAVSVKPKLSLSVQPWCSFVGFVSKLTITVDDGAGCKLLSKLADRKSGSNLDLMFTRVYRQDDKSTGYIFCNKSDIAFSLFTDRIFFNKPVDEAE